MSVRAGASLAVIDTNIWLDLYVFADASAHTLAEALRSATLIPVRSAATDGELHRVLARPAIAQRVPAALAQTLQDWEALARIVLPRRAAPWLCSDPDDQKFLDLSTSAGAHYLFTKDKALLRLARRARQAGLAILEPRHYPPAR